MGIEHTLEQVDRTHAPARERIGTPGSPRLPRSAALRAAVPVLCALAIGAVTLAGCSESAPPSSGQPTFYQDLAQSDAAVDATAAQSMISGYRSNNGLGAVVV